MDSLGNTAPIGQQYVAICEEHGVQVDQNLFNSFSSRSEVVLLRTEAQVVVILQLFTKLNEYKDQYPTRIVVQAPRISKSTVSALATYLKHQNHLKHLTIIDTKLPESTFQVILGAIVEPRATVSPLTHASFINVGLNSSDGHVIAAILNQPLGTLTHLDLSNNAINSQGVKTLTNVTALRNEVYPTQLELNLSGNLVTVELLNTITHGVGALVAFVAGLSLTLSAKWNGLKLVNVISIAIYCVSLFTLLASSCAYHAVFQYPQLHKSLRRADHCSIFLLIAGTYTPFIVNYALHTTIGCATLAAVWLFATIGITKSLFGASSNSSRAIFALVTGWIGLMAQRTMVANMQPEAIVGVVAGGLVYSVGIIFYLLGKRNPIMHVVWHVAVMVAGTFHFLTLSKYVVHVS